MATDIDEDTVHGDIVEQLVITTPEWWDYAVLKLIQSVDGGSSLCEHHISNPKFPNDCVVATEELMAATRRLALLYNARSSPWSTVIYEIWQSSNQQWSFRTDFTYN
jgi:hypothetical protein